MELNEFQKRALSTAVYPDQGNNLPYAVLGLAGEAGELAGKAKKVIRDDGGILTPERREAMIKELGDALWYVADTAFELNITLEAVAQNVLRKLQSRQERDVVRGDGDNR
jgi:NTP pyrophosphatase (non-canonical NTP hydrolase)